MSIDYDEHVLYLKYEEQWERLRDVMEGSDQIKYKGTTYLPKLSGQTDDEYDSYKMRANFVNLSSRIVSTNTGLMFVKRPVINLPKSLSYLYHDTESFTSFNELFYSSVNETLLMGRVGVLINVKDERIVPIIYNTEDILNWSIRDGVIQNLTLREIEVVDGIEEIESIIYLDMEMMNDVGYVCKMTIMREGDVSVVYPTFRGRYLPFIPFCCINTKGVSFDPVKSPVLDVIDLNLSHYRSSADYEHGLHFVAMPTPVLTGISDISKVKIGASAIIMPETDCKAFYLEFLGQGLGALEKALSVKQAQISMFSARIQDTSTKGSESENIVKLRYATDTVTLHDIAIVVELLMSKVCEMILSWMGVQDDDWKIEINKNFVDSQLSHQELATLSSCLMDGTIDEATYIYNLRRGQIIEEGHNVDIKYKFKEPVEEEEDTAVVDKGLINNNLEETKDGI